ncbi:hypothetical protein GCM10011507_23560 [Edaphobacter acidisoli]|uniref:EthD domain-containing protein n=1 Tax=Edaphobacter acidisoli TaxID=2040573 RepID=A0A916RX81_9BACT|nr:hypothetical protein [Edaphobacter acidisoli]GGA71208.1 hypothetical protein GCM10011507_23560 [Edaphobacter acidisoli]
MCKFMLCALLLVPASILAQSSPDMVTVVNVTTAKPGMSQQWEAGRKEHSTFHASQKDAWPVYVYQILTGDLTGSYASVEPEHHWSDFDAHESFDKLDEPEIAKSILPYSAGNTRALYIFRDDLSLDKPSSTPTKMISVHIYNVLPGHGKDFADAVKKINAAIQKTKYPARPSRVYELANGGEAPAYVHVIDDASWAAMQAPDKPLRDALKEAYGDSGPQVLDQLYHSCSKITTELWVYRPDLSYVPQ